MADVQVLDVLLHGELVGTLTHIDGDRTIFGFADAYVANDRRPALGLGFKDRFGELITEFRPTRTRLLPFFSNLLPEGRMRTYLAERAGVDPAREFFLLWVLGMDLPGAITIQSADGGAWLPQSDLHADVDESGNDRLQHALRFSLAGVQLKFVRRLTFNTLIGNADMHLKNWSLLYPDRRCAALAPAYDFVATIAYIPNDTAALKFSRTRLFSEFSEDELSHLAAKAMLPERLVLDTARETVALFYQHWRAEKTHLPIGANVIRAVEEHLKMIPIA